MEPEQTSGVVPIHHRIADALRAQIHSGELAPGDSLPPVKQLSEEWGCSLGSARSALSVLKTEGRITGGRGKPSTVRVPPQRIKLSADWSQKQKDLVLHSREEREQMGAIELTAGISIEQTDATYQYETIKATEELANEFGIDAGKPLMRRVYEMVDTETGELISQSVSYIPRHLIEANPDLLNEDNEPWPGGHQHQLYTVGIELSGFVRSVIAIEPTPGDRQRWGMEPGTPMLCVRSRSVDTDERVVELSDAMYPADRTEVTFTEELNRW